VTFIRRFWWLGWLAVPFLGLLPWVGFFWYQNGSEFSDLAISHLPNALWIQRSLAEWGQIPLWSNTILSGYPFASNPLSGLHYPFGWFFALLPQPMGLNLGMLLHLGLGGVGMFRFLRAEGMEKWAALFGALAYEALPKLSAHMGAGHVSWVYAAGWTPWLLLAERNKGRHWWRPAVFLGLIALADPRWGLISGLMWLGYSLINAYSKENTGRVRVLMQWAVRIGAAGGLSLTCAAFLLLPMMEYTSRTTRAHMTAGEHLVYSLPPERLFGFLAPPFGETAEFVLYPGGLVVLLGLLGFILLSDRKNRFWQLFFVASVIVSLGEALPGAEVLAGLPVINLVRVPPRWLLAGQIALMISAANSLQFMLSQSDQIRKPQWSWFVIISFILLMFGLGLTVVGWQVTGELPVRFAWGGGASLCALGLLFLVRSGRVKPEWFVQLAFVILCLDLVISNRLGIDVIRAKEVYAQGAEAAQYIKQNLPEGRLYSPSYSMPQQTAVSFGLELAEGVDPLQLEPYVEYMRSATGVSGSGYSVTLPPFENGRPKTDNQMAMPDARLLGLLNVTALTSEFPFASNAAAGWEEEKRIGTTVIYRNLKVYPRAWVQPGGQIPGNGEITPLEIKWTPNRIELWARGPGRLILSELAYPGWMVRVDGIESVPLEAVIFRAVDLSAGEHTVVFDYRPVSFFAGLGLSIIGWLVIGGLWLWNRQ
jgi:hypothetical protein